MADLREAYHFIALDSPHYAKILVDQIQDSVSNLSRFPRLGKSLPEYHDDTYREIISGHYRVIYRFQGERNDLIIMAVLHGRRLTKI